MNPPTNAARKLTPGERGLVIAFLSLVAMVGIAAVIYFGSGSPAKSMQLSAPASSSACEPSYPTLCLPRGRDVDCRQISERRFPVRGSDPYLLDGDGDGIGCE